MKVLVVVVALLAVGAYAKVITYEPIINGDEYHEKIGIPEAERIRLAEEQMLSDPSRIVGGSTAVLGQFPYHVGQISTTNNGASSVCGGSLVNNQRVLTAAQCCTGTLQITVVLGSITLFSGGIRLVVTPSNQQIHSSYNPINHNSDIAILNLPVSVTFSNIINPIALPTGTNNFAGADGIVSGHGRKMDGDVIEPNQQLQHATVQVITNAVCQQTLGTGVVTLSTICTSGAEGRGTCGGDSGGPLVTWFNNTLVLIGVSSFTSIHGCQVGRPAGFVRVTSFADWIRVRM